MEELIIIGGGLAGCEAAWQASRFGINVHLFEMRPEQTTPAHLTEDLAELVCSNSLGSMMPDRPSGLLLEELKTLNSLLIDCAIHSSIPAGGALALDRREFSRLVSEKIDDDPHIQVHRKPMTIIPDVPTICASGPLTSPELSRALTDYLGMGHLFFYDAIAPIVEFESIDTTIAFRASRFDRSLQGDGDYLNCPLTADEYHSFVDALLKAERASLRTFENAVTNGVNAGSGYFEGCLPIEIMAERGTEALAFGPMRPIGLRDPRMDQRPYAVVQLRQDNLAGNLYNMVGFQTNLIYHEQEKVFRMIPGLQNARFVRFGQMHRNTFLVSPLILEPTLQYRKRPDLFFAGQLAGVEGYMGSIATGLVAGINAARIIRKKQALTFPTETMIGALCQYLACAEANTFQPMKANFGLLPPLPRVIRNKKEKKDAFAQRSLTALKSFSENLK